MMPRLTVATVATAAPMGAQVYQEEIAQRAPEALASHGEWRVRRSVTRSLRSQLPGTNRLPMAAVAAAPPSLRRAAGALLYAPGSVVHRMNLELPPGAFRDVVTLHDVVSWKFPDESAPIRAAQGELRRADAVICVSHFSAAEAVELLGVEKPHVVHNGVNQRFFDSPALSRPELDALGVPGAFVLAAGGASKRKNLQALAAAWPKIHSSRPDLTLVLSGPEHPRRTELFKGLSGVRMVGRVPDTTIPSLVAAASAVVVPSLYEGFGLPALEGMAANVPVVAANTSSLPEVVGDGGVLIEPTAEAIAEGTLWAVSGDSEIAAMVSRGRTRAAAFTWEKSAAEHARIWASLV